MTEKFKIELVYPVEKQTDQHMGAEKQGFFEKRLLSDLSGKRSLSTPPWGLLRIATATPESAGDRTVDVRIYDEAV